jgi:UDPglucose 6-dehydrogenase
VTWDPLAPKAVILLSCEVRPVKVCVAGLWHLGLVTAACVAGAGHDVVAFEDDTSAVALLDEGRLPLFEPGLDDLVRNAVAGGTLRFTANRTEALGGADLLWIAYDTPVDDDDRADVEFVVERARRLLEAAGSTTVTLVSSQLPVGTTRRLEGFAGEGRTIAYSPENLRLGNAIAAFAHQERIVVGVRPAADRSRIETLLSPFCDRIEWMGVESAELTKHGLNAFLATSIAFANELAVVAEHVGADAREVERGLKTDPRIGSRAYLKGGAAFAGGTLARDVEFLTVIGERTHVSTHLLRAVRVSNDAHKRWAREALAALLGDDLEGHTIGVWGLVYKPGTDTLRRSSSIELCKELAGAGACVRGHDVAVRALPEELGDVLTVCETPLDAVAGASALVVATEWPAYREVGVGNVVSAMRTPNVVDPGGFLSDTLGSSESVRYATVGRSSP